MRSATKARILILKIFSLGCGGNLSDPKGVLSSPFFPNPYPNNFECIYKVTQAIGTYVSLTIIYMDIDCENYDTYYDFLEIRNGDSESSPSMGKYCSNRKHLENPVLLQSASNNLWIRLIL